MLVFYFFSKSVYTKSCRFSFGCAANTDFEKWIKI